MVFFTYHGAFIAILRILFWSTCILSMCVFDAEFCTAQAYSQFGLMHVKQLIRLGYVGVFYCLRSVPFKNTSRLFFYLESFVSNTKNISVLMKNIFKIGLT